jgi:hypothetical protein
MRVANVKSESRDVLAIKSIDFCGFCAEVSVWGEAGKTQLAALGEQGVRVVRASFFYGRQDNYHKAWQRYGFTASDGCQFEIMGGSAAQDFQGLTYVETFEELLGKPCCMAVCVPVVIGKVGPALPYTNQNKADGYRRVVALCDNTRHIVDLTL